VYVLLRTRRLAVRACSRGDDDPSWIFEFIISTSAFGVVDVLLTHGRSVGRPSSLSSVDLLLVIAITSLTLRVSSYKA
jgi:hypothetical protein